MSEQNRTAAAVALLAELGLDAATLAALAAARTEPVVPTFGEYVERLSATIPHTRGSHNYLNCWARLVTEGGFGPRRLDEPTVSEFKAFIAAARENRVRRRNGRDGASVELGFVNALRKLYQLAEDDGYITEQQNPARRLARPRIQPSARHALPGPLLAEINRVAAVTGRDPELDLLMIRLHTETACRRSTAMALRPRDLDAGNCLVHLREKGGLFRWHPVSPTLMRALAQHAATRCTDPDAQLLRGVTRKPVREDRYARLFGRLGRYIPEVANHNITAHWLRHTTLTWVERTFGYSVARAYAGHVHNQRYNVTLAYTKADLAELAHVVQTLTGEPHPLLVPRPPATSAPEPDEPPGLDLPKDPWDERPS